MSCPEFGLCPIAPYCTREESPQVTEQRDAITEAAAAMMRLADGSMFSDIDDDILPEETGSALQPIRNTERDLYRKSLTMFVSLLDIINSGMQTSRQFTTLTGSRIDPLLVKTGCDKGAIVTEISGVEFRHCASNAVLPEVRLRPEFTEALRHTDD